MEKEGGNNKYNKWFEIIWCGFWCIVGLIFLIWIMSKMSSQNQAKVIFCIGVFWAAIALGNKDIIYKIINRDEKNNRKYVFSVLLIAISLGILAISMDSGELTYAVVFFLGLPIVIGILILIGLYSRCKKNNRKYIFSALLIAVPLILLGASFLSREEVLNLNFNLITWALIGGIVYGIHILIGLCSQKEE